MLFEPELYGTSVAEILAVDGGGRRLMPLAIIQPVCPEATNRLQNSTARSLFSASRAPEAALSGL